MKKIKIIVMIVIISLLSFWLSSCGGGVAVGIDLAGAKVEFVTWIGNQAGVPGNAVGNFLCALNVGDVISSEDPSEEESSERQSTPMNEAGWLFYLDEQPGGFYPHPGRILAISKTGQTMFQEKVQGWPTVNQQVPDIFLDPNHTRITKDPGQWTVYNPEKVFFPPFIIDYIDIFPIPVRLHGAVVTCGLTPTQNLYTETMNVSDQMFDALWDLFNCSVGDERVVKVENPDNQASDIAAAIADLASKKVTNMTLYFIAHGGHQAMNMGGYSYYCSTLKTLLESYPNITFTLIFETCHGGSWTDYFEALGGTGMPNVDMVISSTTSDKNAYGDMDSSEGITDHNASLDQYIEFTSDFLLQMEFWTDPTNWPTIQGLTTPAFGNNTLKLYYYCYQCVKNRYYPAAALPIYQSYVLPERTPILIQEPQIYHP